MLVHVIRVEKLWLHYDRCVVEDNGGCLSLCRGRDLCLEETDRFRE